MLRNLFFSRLQDKINHTKYSFTCVHFLTSERECVTRFLTSSFFHDSNPSGPLISRLKFFSNFVVIFDHKVVFAVCNILQR